MRIDVLTIFPDYLDPLRHALLGKAIEEGLLSVKVHNLRHWATGRHKAVDDTPYGGGPGMVMKPTVWGPAIDDVRQRTGPAAESEELATAQPHSRAERHDDRVGRTFSGYAPAASAQDAEHTADTQPQRPVLIVPTPAGRPFTQADAQDLSTREHLIFACGRYEGIDQRVISDAARTCEVREISIGDYVLIGGEVATLVITEAVVRLIPGVLGNATSHQEDSFSDGLLEAPSFTKPPVWRGLAVPPLLTSGDHKKIARYRRDEALRRTQRTRPDLIDTLDRSGALTPRDRKAFTMKPMHTELQILANPKEMKAWAKELPARLEKVGYHNAQVEAEPISLACEPDNMLVTQYEQFEGHPPITEDLHRLLVNGETELDEKAATQAVVGLFPSNTYWYGTSNPGHIELGSGPACALPVDARPED